MAAIKDSKSLEVALVDQSDQVCVAARILCGSCKGMMTACPRRAARTFSQGGRRKVHPNRPGPADGRRKIRLLLFGWFGLVGSIYDRDRDIDEDRIAVFGASAQKVGMGRDLPSNSPWANNV